MVVRRSIERLLLLLLLLSLLLCTLGITAAARRHDRVYGVEKKLSVLRGIMVVLFGNSCLKGERELLMIVKRERMPADCRRERELLVLL